MWRVNLVPYACYYMDHAASGEENPTGEVNLNKNTAYNNALKCLTNQSSVCPSGTSLNESGLLHVNASSSNAYCRTSNCANQTLIQLRCVSLVWRDFRFNNDASVSDLESAITTGCTNGNFTITITNDAIRVRQMTSSILIITIIILGFMGITI
eukprot:c20288_g1_i1 orf=844-1305(+)